jgi:hypothetical protein
VAAIFRSNPGKEGRGVFELEVLDFGVDFEEEDRIDLGFVSVGK